VSSIRRFACSDRSGSITVRVDRFPAEHVLGGHGAWTILAGTGRYVHLQGRGTWTTVSVSGEPLNPATTHFRTIWRGVAASPPAASSASISSARGGGGQVDWYRWDTTSDTLQARRPQFGSTIVLGLESMSDLAALRKGYGLELVRAIPSLRAAEVRVDAARLEALLAKAPTDQRLRYVSPLGPKRRSLGMPGDPLVQMVDPITALPYEWQFTALRGDRALDYTPGDPAVVVGIIDTGISNVPDLAGKIDGLWSVTPDGALTADSLSDGNDDTGHGTAVASLIAANVDDGVGMAGFGGGAHVIAVHAGYYGYFRDISIAIALMKLDALGVRIVNMSLGGPSPSEPILIDAIHKAAADGILLVAAAGNAHGEVAWPAAALQPSDGRRSFGLAVGASDVNGRLAPFSNAGKHLSLVAPGAYDGTCLSGVLVALPADNLFDESYCYPRWAGAGGAVYGYLSGTSFSAPEVAGVAALIWAARPDLRNYQVADIIKQSARRDPGWGWAPTIGCGNLDAGAALELATSRTSAQWAAGTSSGSTDCSVDGAQPAMWPDEVSQTITFARLRDRSVAEPDFKVTATASSGLPVSYGASGTCTFRGTTVHPTGVGRCRITASQPGNANYDPARPVSRAFSIYKAPPSRHRGRLPRFEPRR
jgi:subtilisin family serine protease